MAGDSLYQVRFKIFRCGGKGIFWRCVGMWSEKRNFYGIS